MCNDPNYPSNLPSAAPHPQTTWQSFSSVTNRKTQGSLCQNILPCKTICPLSPSILISFLVFFLQGGYFIIIPLFHPHRVVEAKFPPSFSWLTQRALCCHELQSQTWFLNFPLAQGHKTQQSRSFWWRFPKVTCLSMDNHLKSICSIKKIYFLIPNSNSCSSITLIL